MKRSRIVIIVLLAVVLPVLASEFRSAKRITTPTNRPKGATSVKHIQQLPRKQVVEAVETLTKAWNTPEMSKTLAREFYDQSQLQDSMNSTVKVPRDAKLTVLGIGAIQTVDQYQQKDQNGVSFIISTVTVTLRTQIEFDDATHGYQRLAGINEFTLKMTQKAEEQA